MKGGGMNELEFLNGEAKVASAAAPRGIGIEVRAGARGGRYDVLFGGSPVAKLLGRDEALACIMGIGGALTVLAATRANGGASCGGGRVTVVDRFQRNWKKTFRTREKCRAWLMEGMAGCEGAEQEHYTNMLLELEGGASVLHYN